jgi:multidrug efflux system membrane fusion protein
MSEKTAAHPLRLVSLVVLVLAGVGYAAWRIETPAVGAQAPVIQAVPVQLASAARRDVAVYLTGLGTVTAFNSVTVHTRVDGELQQVLYKEGQDVKKGDVLAVIDPRTFQAALDQANGKLQQDSATLDNARIVLGRDAQLGKSDFASPQTIDNQRSTVQQLEAQVVQDHAMVSTAQTQLSYTRIVAPIDGRVGLRLVDQGNIVHATDTTGLVVLNQIHPISVVSTLPQENVQAVRAALAAGAAQAQAISREKGSVLDTGTVETIDNQIDPSSGTFRLKSTFPNKDDSLWPGQFVDLKVQVAMLHNVLTVPSDAIQRGSDGLFVYAVDKNETANPVPVKAGQISEGAAVIESGLEEGQRVVVSGQYRLSQGTKITATPPGETTQAAEGTK